ncbi:MAG TPA: hypothetical protein DCG06_02155 [Deltaproteobacteria bacterium]|nr:hypothetical protein [Deltaproteobacteria bacterium]
MNLPKSRSTTFLLALAVTAFASCGGSSDSSNQLNGIWSGYTSAICPQERATAFSSFTEFHVSNGRLTEVFCDSEPIGVTGQFTAREDNLFRLSLSTGEPTAFYSDGDHAAILVSYGRPDEYGMGALQGGGHGDRPAKLRSARPIRSIRNLDWPNDHDQREPQPGKYAVWHAGDRVRQFGLSAPTR